MTLPRLKQLFKNHTPAKHKQPKGEKMKMISFHILIFYSETNCLHHRDNKGNGKTQVCELSCFSTA